MVSKLSVGMLRFFGWENSAFWPGSVAFIPHSLARRAESVRGMGGKIPSAWLSTGNDRVTNANVRPRARICKRLRRPGIDSVVLIPPDYVARRAGTTNRVVVPARQAGNRVSTEVTFWPSAEYGSDFRCNSGEIPQKLQNCAEITSEVKKFRGIPWTP